MSYFKKHKEGFVFSAIFHILIIGILLYFGFFTPLPLPQEQGILVDFGTTETGMGKIDPPQKKTPPKQQKVEEQEVVKPQSTVQPETSTNPEKNTKDILTQDYEESVAIDEARKKDALKAAEEKERLQEKRTADSLQQIENERLAELKRAENEKKRQDSIRKAEEEAKIAAINSRAKNVFNNSGQTITKASKNQGSNNTEGNEGSNNGTSNVSRTANGGGEGITFNLTGRDLRTLIKPVYSENEEGIVVVQINVDRDGNVLSAKAGAKGTTTMNQNLWQAAQKAALATKFDKNQNATSQQIGTITYKFVLN